MDRAADADAGDPRRSASAIASFAGSASFAGPANVHSTDRARDLLNRTFGLADVSELRHAVSRCAATAGLAGQALDDFVLAINELITNAVRHGGGTGAMRLWQSDGALVCEVSDHGAGITREVDGHHKPPPSVVGGWGLWLARQLSDTMAVRTGPTGTAVRISAALPAGRRHTAPSD